MRKFIFRISLFLLTGGLLLAPTLNVNPKAANGDGKIRAAISLVWATVHDRTVGDVIVLDSDSTGAGVYLLSTNYYRLYRAFMAFDTSAIPAGATITAATLTLTGTAKADSDNDAYSYLAIVSATPADPDSLVLEDLDQAGSEIGGGALTDTIMISAWNYGWGPNVFTFTAAGRAYIANHIGVGGITALAVREGHDLANQAPDVQSDTGTTASYFTLESTTESYRPLLSVTYTVAGTATNVAFFGANF